MAKKTHVSPRKALHASRTCEWITPPEYITLVKKVLGPIDLDPASSARANKIVKARAYYTKADNGLTCPWYGRVFCNPPYDRSTGLWVNAMVSNYEHGEFFHGILLVNAVPDRRWFRQLWNYLICFANSRIRFICPDGKPGRAPTHGSAFVYFGPSRSRFCEIFSPVGIITGAARGTRIKGR